MSDLFLDPDIPASGCPRVVRRALLMVAPSHQGGHSDKGRVLAQALGVRFPLRMDDLKVRAKTMGFDPGVVWPWLEDLHNKEGD